MSRAIRFGALVLSVLVVAVAVGFAAAVLVLVLLQAVLPPFRREDGDTLREFVPVALAYAAWAIAALVTLVLGWRRIRRYR